MKRVAVILSGCGVYDGTEIHEAVLTLLALDRAGAQTQCFAPDINQFHVVNHLTGAVAPDEMRNVLVESARIARGAVKPLDALAVADFDAVILPGGFGAAKNLSNFATAGAALTVNSEVAQALQATQNAGKPLGFLCISPVIAAQLFGKTGVSVTIGDDPGTAAAITAQGAHHVVCPVGEVVVDTQHKIFSTPAYMLGPSLKDIAIGIEKLVTALLAAA